MMPPCRSPLNTMWCTACYGCWPRVAGLQAAAQSGHLMLPSAALQRSLRGGNALTLDPAKIHARTPAGDSEMRTPMLGLSLTQRRLLSLITNNATLEQLAAAQQWDSARVERELARLVDLGLIRGEGRPAPVPVAVRGKGVAAPTAPMTPAAATIPEAVVLGRQPGRLARVALLAGVTTVAAAAAFWVFSPATQEPAKAQSQALASSALAVSPAPALTPPAFTPPAVPPVVMPSDAGPTMRTVLQSRPTPVAPISVSAGGDGHETNAVVAATGAKALAIAPTDAASPPVKNATSTPIIALPRAAALPSPTPAPAIEPIKLALAAPAVLSAAVTRPSLVPVSRETPEFPREALQANVEHGTVKARVSIDKDGKVTQVDIVDAQPHRVFDKAVVRALSHWRFEPDAAARTTEIEVAFNRN